MTKNLIIKLGIFFVALLILSNLVNALGISPGRITVDFESKLHKEISFKLINNEHKDMKVLVYLEGELAQYITLHEVLVDFKANEESKGFAYEINLPEKIETPGTHSVNIIAMELPPGAEEKGTFVGATISVATQLYVKVPYPGKYAEATLQISEAMVNETVSFVIPVLNYGEEEIVRAYATIDILGPTNEKLATVTTNDAAIGTKGRAELIANWQANVNPGLYYAVARINYDSKLIRLEQTFSVGQLLIEVVDVNVKNFRLGGVAKFNILLKNHWANKVNDVYAQMVINNKNNDQIADFKSANADIEPLGEALLNSFWDTEGVESGTYNAKVILHYEGKTTEKLMKAEITLDEIRISFLGATAEAIAIKSGLKQNSILMLMLLALVIINISWFVFFKKRLARRK